MYDFPTRSDLATQTRTDIATEYPGCDPFSPNTLLNALAVALSYRTSEINDIVRRLFLDSYSTTASGDALLAKASEYGIYRRQPTTSTGRCVFTSRDPYADASPVSIGAEIFTNSTGVGYTVMRSVPATYVTLDVSSITTVGLTATANFLAPHGLASGMWIVIDGVEETVPETGDNWPFNSPFAISVNSPTSFTFTVSDPGEPLPSIANGDNITCSFNGGFIDEVVALVAGESGNQPDGVTLQEKGSDNIYYVPYTTFAGGLSTETDEDMRKRLVYRQGNPVTPFNEYAITDLITQKYGDTRVWVQSTDSVTESQTPTSVVAASGFVTVTLPANHNSADGVSITVEGASVTACNGTFTALAISDTKFAYYVSGATGTSTGTITVTYSNVPIGMCRVLFVKDLFPNIIPTGEDITNVKNAIVGIKPLNVPSASIAVLPPDLLPVDFEFTSIYPDSPALRSAIEANLYTLFAKLDINSTLTMNQIIGSIHGSYAVETGEKLETFVLASPSANITTTYKQLPVLGSITYA